MYGSHPDVGMYIAIGRITDNLVRWDITDSFWKKNKKKNNLTLKIKTSEKNSTKSSHKIVDVVIFVFIFA